MQDRDYVSQTLELHLFFGRIMREHAIFLQAGFTPKNSDLANEASNFKVQFERLLHNALSIAPGHISPGALESQELFTDYTKGTETKTQNFTGITIDPRITEAEGKLWGAEDFTVTPELMKGADNLNNMAKPLLDSFVRYKAHVLDRSLSCAIFTVNYPLQLDHILREAKTYQKLLQNTQNKSAFSWQDFLDLDVFWTQIMEEHAEFQRGLLDPTERQLIAKSDEFARAYAQLLKKAQSAATASLQRLTNETIRLTEDFKNFKAEGTAGIAECKIKAVILPLLADHVLREANNFLRLLKINS